MVENLEKIKASHAKRIIYAAQLLLINYNTPQKNNSPLLQTQFTSTNISSYRNIFFLIFKFQLFPFLYRIILGVEKENG